MSRKNFIDRLPRIWRELDHDGILERFLAIWDQEYDSVNDHITSLLDTRSPRSIPNKYLPMLGALVGHEWRSDRSYQHNRDNIAQAIHTHSFKGTANRIEDILGRLGSAENFTLQDNVSKLCILGVQGKLSSSDCYLMNSDYYHEGAKVLTIQNSIDVADLLTELVYTLSAGERWWFSVIHPMNLVYEAVWTRTQKGIWPTTNALEGTLGYGTLGGDLFLSTEPNGWLRSLQYLYRDGVAGGYLQIDSPTSIDNEDFDIDEGTTTNPLPTTKAILQLGIQHTVI